MHPERARRSPSSRQHAARTAAEAQPARTTALEACRRGERAPAGVPMRRAGQTSMRLAGRTRWWGGGCCETGGGEAANVPLTQFVGSRLCSGCAFGVTGYARFA